MILIVTQTFAPAKGGMEAYMTSLAEQLALAGHETLVLADGNEAAYAPLAPYKLKRYNGWRPFRRLKKRLAIMRLRNIEGVFCDSWKSVEALPQNLKAPVAVLAHGAEYPVSASPRKRRRIEKALARSTAILANSRFTTEAVQPYLANAADPRLKVFHPPVNRMPEPSVEEQNRMHLLIGGRHPVISVLARLEPRKGIDRVIEAMPQIAAKYPSAVFLVGGGGEDEQRLRALAQEMGVENHVLFLGVLDNDRKAALFAVSDIFAMPVRRVGPSVEGFGISYIEAGWYGVPGIAGKTGGAKDAVLNDITGLLCDGDNAADVASKILRLLDDEKLRQRLGYAAQYRARNELLWEKALPRFLGALGIPR